jgi:hypothetical protein
MVAKNKLELTHCSLAKGYDLFRYKEKGFQLEDFPGYTNDQWGIKAHNRPWIEEFGNFAKGQKILEVGGAYSLLPKYLAEKYDLEAWVGDDFGQTFQDSIWSRWGDPHEYAQKHPSTHYVFELFGTFSKKYPDSYFDRIFSVSTLEHIPMENMLDVFKDMHRCLKPGGRQLHTIDIPTKSFKATVLAALVDKLPALRKIYRKANSEIRTWIELIQSSGVGIDTRLPSSLELFDRKTLVESLDVVYRFYPPANAPKPYSPAASLLIIIDSKL